MRRVNCFKYELRQVEEARHGGALEVGGDAVREEFRSEAINIIMLAETDVCVLNADIDSQEVSYISFVLHGPTGLKVGGEAMIQRVLVVMRAEHEQVVDVGTDDEPFAALTVRSIDFLAAVEHARVAVGLLERVVVPLSVNHGNRDRCHRRPA